MLFRSKNGLKEDCSLRKSLAKTLPKSMEELMARIEKYARAEEDTSGNKEVKQEKGNGSPKQGRGNNRFSKSETELRSKQAVTTVFRIPIHKVLDQIRNQPYLRAPAKTLGEYMGRNVGRRCAYHNEEGAPNLGLQSPKSTLRGLSETRPSERPYR